MLIGSGTTDADVGAPIARAVSTLHLLSGPRVTFETTTRDIPEGSARLLILLSLDRRPLSRHYVAEKLWPGSREQQAGGCLRTAIWRLRKAELDIVDVSNNTLQLSPEVRVDADELKAWAIRMVQGRPTPDDLVCRSEWRHGLDLLPGWYDDWVNEHRERLRQLVLHALDELARQLSMRKRHAEAIDAALCAVESDPLRESAQRVLIEAHLCEGNIVEARRVLLRFERQLFRELGVFPSLDLYDLVHLRAPRVACRTNGNL